MSDHSDAVWDEYQWERFLQQQEKRTEKYMELLEKYIDHPERDEIIAREMNWTHLLDDSRRAWEDEVDAAFEQEAADLDPEEENAVSGEGGEAGEGGQSGRKVEGYPFENHPLYRQAIDLSTEWGKFFDDLGPKAAEHPSVNALQTAMTIVAAKLAAALSDGSESEDLGMCIAYLKRAVHAMNECLTATAQMETLGILDEAQASRLRAQLFSIRDGIVSKTGESRAEFRRRHGA